MTDEKKTFAQLLTEAREIDEKHNAEFRSMMADSVAGAIAALKTAESQLAAATDDSDIAKKSAILMATATSAAAAITAAAIRVAVLESVCARTGRGIFGL